MGDVIEYDEINAAKEHSRIEAVDRRLAGGYCFTDEELDFLINYDIKYRLGAGADEAED